MTKRGYVRRYMLGVRRIEKEIERSAPHGIDGRKLARHCRRVGRAVAEANARELSRMRNRDRRMKQSLKEVEGGCIRPVAAL